MLVPLDVVTDAVSDGLKTAGLEDNTANRLKVLKLVHAGLSEDRPITHYRNLILLEIEKEVVRLEAL